jgi:pyruvate formate lyase activating enzyme
VIKEASYYEKRDDNMVRCVLCPHNCTISEDQTGICGVRRNRKGKLYSEIYGQLTSVAMDPIEKKPLYHFYPSSSILSIGTRGCNMKCPYCQNWHISQDLSVPVNSYSPEEIAEAASRKDSIGIAYTYSEPLIWYEYVLDTAKIISERGLKNVLVTNGFINREPLDELLRYTDAMNIDLKSFNPETYKKVQKATREGVTSTIEQAYGKCHIEITTLIVTGINDTVREMKEIIDFISSLDKNIPWHISRYYPNYKYNAPATDIDFMMKVCDLAAKKLSYVYCGNIPPGRKGNNTLCPSCGALLIERSGYYTRVRDSIDGTCKKCGYETGITG